MDGGDDGNHHRQRRCSTASTSVRGRDGLSLIGECRRSGRGFWWRRCSTQEGPSHFIYRDESMVNPAHARTWGGHDKSLLGKMGARRCGVRKARGWFWSEADVLARHGRPRSAIHSVRLPSVRQNDTSRVTSSMVHRGKEKAGLAREGVWVGVAPVCTVKLNWEGSCGCQRRRVRRGVHHDHRGCRAG
jgi:hypothetical protein